MSEPVPTTDAVPLPAPRPGLRLTLHPGRAVLRIVTELEALELAGAEACAEPADGDAEPTPSAPQAWATRAAQEGFRVVTASIDGLLVGFVAGTVRDGVVDVRQITVSAAARARHPELAGELADGYIEAAGLPWGAVEVRPDSPALAHLLAQGWRPSPVQDEPSRLHLSGHLA